MSGLIRFEWIKFRSVRSTVITLLLAGVLVVLVAVLSANDANGNVVQRCEQAPVEQAAGTKIQTDHPACGPESVMVSRTIPTNLTGLTGGAVFAALIFGVLGVQIIGQEYRFNTIRPTFTAAPHRWKVLAAKLIVVTAACAAVAAVMVAVCLLVGTVMLDEFTIDGTDQRVAWGIVLFSALWCTAGMGIGSIVRQPVAGIVILILEALVVEGLVGGLFEGTKEWLPFTNGLQMTYRADDADAALRPLLDGGIYFAIVCAAVWLIGGYLVNKRDA